MQVFLTYQQQIDKLKKEKGLLIRDEQYAKAMLQQIGYFSLISGYKDIFKNPTTKRYRDNIQFEDIVLLYDFDSKLRELFLSYLLKIENQIKSMLSYAFCEEYGAEQSAYLNKENYNYVGKRNQKDIDKLVIKLGNLANYNSDYNYINHSRERYGNVPLWVLLKAVTFGTISVMYQVQPSNIKSKISREYSGVNERQLAQLLRFLVRFRNVCAHGERLFSYRNMESIPDFPAHKKLAMEKAGEHYIGGKHDLFAVVIALRYLLSEEDFKNFREQLQQQIQVYFKEMHENTEYDILKKMGFPENWRDIAK